MTLQDVWGNFEYIWGSIFSSDGPVAPDWLRACPLSGKEANILNKPLDINMLKTAWQNCFNSQDRKTARAFIQHMMLFMVFDGTLADFDKQNFCKRADRIIQRMPQDGIRAWAFKQCFGVQPDNAYLVDIARMARDIIRCSGYSPQ